MTRKHVLESVSAIRARTEHRPEIGIVLGTGLTELADLVRDKVAVAYEDIPHFARPTVESHPGRLVLGTLGEKRVAVMQGRIHFYEGYDLAQVTHPIRVMKELGVRTVVLSNACGGLNPNLRTGDIVVITDHINLSGHSPLRGPNDDELGPRFPDMAACYDPMLVELARKTALDIGIQLAQGVYAWVTGPNLETAAECRFLRLIGADLVGMSTVPEVIVARHGGMKCLGFSVVTDMAVAETLKPVSLPDVLAAARAAEPKLTKLLVEILKRM
ncbi:MAG: purine-nucleoside phosphorylase [candidate division WOR-3 bacterium]